jgi:hypothetical protein
MVSNPDFLKIRVRIKTGSEIKIPDLNLKSGFNTDFKKSGFSSHTFFFTVLIVTYSSLGYHIIPYGNRRFRFLNR